MYCFQFAVFLLVILIVEIAIGIVVFVKMDGDGWKQAVQDSIKEKFDEYDLHAIDSPINKEIDNFQRNVSQCCMLKKMGQYSYPYIRAILCNCWPE